MASAASRMAISSWFDLHGRLLLRT